VLDQPANPERGLRPGDPPRDSYLAADCGPAACRRQVLAQHAQLAVGGPVQSGQKIN
jgi:hypothetical protein